MDGKNFYRHNLISFAYDLMESKGNADDAKALDDVMLISAILSGFQQAVDPYQVDQRLRREYSKIEDLEKEARKYTYLISAGTGKAATDWITERLYADARGICADVLFKHGKITCIKDMINVVDSIK